MPNYDEDAVQEAMNRIQPLIDELTNRITELESRPAKNVLVTEYVAKLENGEELIYKLEQ